MLQIEQSKSYDRDLRRMVRRGKDLTKLRDVILILREGEKLPEQYRDHALRGDWEGYRECHIESN